MTYEQKQNLIKRADLIYKALKKGVIVVMLNNTTEITLNYELEADSHMIHVKEHLWDNEKPKYEAIIPLSGIILKTKPEDYEFVIKTLNDKKENFYNKFAVKIVKKFHSFNCNLTFPNISKNPIKIIK